MVKKDTIDVFWNQETDSIVLSNKDMNASAGVTVRLKFSDLSGHVFCDIHRTMRIEPGRSADVWRLPGPKDPFVQIFIGGADGAESAAPAPREMFSPHRMDLRLYDLSGNEVIAHQYERQGGKKQ
jgi:hypothetical protein